MSLSHLVSAAVHMLGSDQNDGDEQDGSDCIETSIIGNADKDTVQIEGYMSKLTKLYYFFGAVHLVIVIAIVVYIVVSLISGHRLSKFQVTYLSNLIFVEICYVIVMFGYFGVGDGVKNNCGYYDKVFYGVTDIFLFNVSILIGHKQYTMSSNLYEFAVKGNLPSKWSVRRNKLILYCIWGVSLAEMVTFIFMNTYWTFINRDMASLRLFNFSNKMA